MKQSNLSMIISSCGAFSDLWDGHITQLERFWGDRSLDQTILVTDEPTDVTYENVKVFAAGAGIEWSRRLKSALDLVRTEYVIITLDDYFLIETVDQARIDSLVDIMRENGLDYFRLFRRPKRATGKQIGSCAGICRVDTSVAYSVNLTTGIWKTDFAKYCSNCDLNAWRFEVALSGMAQSYGASCAVDNNDDFVILDVVRKGKLLRKSANYFKKNPGLYQGSREVNTFDYEFRLGVRTMVGRHTPMWLHKRIKNMMRSLGREFYTEE